MEQDLKTKVSKYMSYLLRHNPENLKIDRHGFVNLDQLTEKVRERFQVNKKLVLEIVEKSDRKRFEIREDMIRATYGHTIAVKLELEEDKTTKRLYHGTTPDAASKILRKGLKPMKRRWVHLSPTIRIAKEVGFRKTRKPVILEIDAEAARNKGVRFYKTSDRVYLCNDLLPEFIKLAKTKRNT